MGQVAFNSLLYVETCCVCYMEFGVPSDFYAARRKDHANFYCPRGHGQSYTGQTTEEKRIAELELQVQAEKARAKSAQRQREWAEAATRGANIAAGKAKAAKRRLEARVSRGVCPCCRRTFKQLAAHMKTKHPEMVR